MPSLTSSQEWMSPVWQSRIPACSGSSCREMEQLTLIFCPLDISSDVIARLATSLGLWYHTHSDIHRHTHTHTHTHTSSIKWAGHRLLENLTLYIIDTRFQEQTTANDTFYIYKFLSGSEHHHRHKSQLSTGVWKQFTKIKIEKKNNRF